MIRALSVPDPGLTLAEVARATGLARAAARRFLLTLERLGYVRVRDRRFTLTARVLELGYSYLAALSLPEVAQPHLRDLVQRVHESSSLSVLDGTDIVYVAREPTRRIMTVAIAVGTRFPASATSMGRVLLAGLEEAEVEEFFLRAELDERTVHTVTDPGELRAELARVRAQGWALVDQELEAGLRSIAVPVRNGRGRVLAAVNVSAHASRTTLEVMREAFLPALRVTAGRIEHDLALGTAPNGHEGLALDKRPKSR